MVLVFTSLDICGTGPERRQSVEGRIQTTGHRQRHRGENEMSNVEMHTCGLVARFCESEQRIGSDGAGILTGSFCRPKTRFEGVGHLGGVGRHNSIAP